MKPKTIIIGSIVGGVLVVLILVGLLIFVVFRVTSPLTDTADEFFTHLSNKDFDKAYQMTSLPFQKKVSKEYFDKLMQKSGFVEFKEANWGNRKIENDKGELDGSITTRKGGKILLKMSLLKEEEGWKVNYIYIDEVGGVSESSDKEIPPMETCTKLINQSMGWFLTAVENEDFGGLYNNISDLWQKETSPEKLAETFSVFYTHKEQLGALRQAPPILSENPSFDENGWLVLTGYYTAESKIAFTLSFVLENSEWKLAGIKVRIE